MLELLYNFNLKRLSLAGYIMFAALLAITLCVCVPMFLALFAEFRGKGVVAIPIFAGGAMLIGGFVAGEWLLRNMGVSVHRPPAGRVMLVGRGLEEAEDKLGAMRPFLSATQLPRSSAIVVTQVASDSPNEIDDQLVASFDDALNSEPELLIWTIVNTEQAESSKQVLESLKSAKELVDSKRYTSTMQVRYAVDSKQVTGLEKYPMACGWSQIADVLKSHQFEPLGKADGLKKLGSIKPYVPLALVGLLSFWLAYDAIRYAGSFHAAQRTTSLLLIPSILLLGFWMFALWKRRRHSFLTGVGVAGLQTLLIAICWANKTFGLNLFANSTRGLEAYCLNVMVVSLFLAGISWMWFGRSGKVAEVAVDSV